jgi:hypothetical protein
MYYRNLDKNGKLTQKNFTNMIYDGLTPKNFRKTIVKFNVNVEKKYYKKNVEIVFNKLKKQSKEITSYRFKQKSIITPSHNISFIESKHTTKNNTKLQIKSSSNSSNQSNSKLTNKSLVSSSHRQSMDSLAEKLDQNKLDPTITQNDPQLDANTMSSLTPNNNVTTSNIDYNFNTNLNSANN